ncbi:exodeoxyribonuclease III [Alkalicella caledoniensis]|uniref:Exodeoxyribonuclease III n=1 Tax=Alkalicella caledoniensis TaxID=2731377 RepID=A0A7G9WCY3_ALKCA|nr:exodeoxyribonuclease III [Alkalicella caledoniensis]QNO16545.1 exodeoxyribonuclease III [Alkalicella caledoniensis]
MRLVSWNVNGFRSCLGKGFMEYFNSVQADVFCLQETKLSEGQVEVELGGYYQYWNYAVKKGYSGTAVFSRIEPLSVAYGLGEEKHDQEGRLITLEFEDFYLVNSYTPNAQRQLARLEYRLEWEKVLRTYLLKLKETKPVVLCGDLNVAHREIDLKNPKTNRKNAGFSDEERNEISTLLDSGFIDTFRYFYENKTDAYSWWSYMRNARERNIGWRIDYFIVSKELESRLVDAKIDCDIMGSDHCPVVLEVR